MPRVSGFGTFKNGSELSSPVFIPKCLSINIEKYHDSGKCGFSLDSINWTSLFIKHNYILNDFASNGHYPPPPPWGSGI